MTTRVDPCSIEELYGHLLAHEIRLEQQQLGIDLAIAGANFVGQGNARGGHGGKHNSSSVGGMDVEIHLLPPQVVQSTRYSTRQVIKPLTIIINMIILTPQTPPTCMPCLQFLNLHLISIGT